MATKNNPGAYDCYANAHPDEPMFVLLGRDKFAGSLVRLWAEARLTDDEAHAKVWEARDCADAMDECCRALGKTPQEVLCWVPYRALEEEMRRRGAVIAPAQHGGDFADDGKPLPPLRTVSIEFRNGRSYTVREGNRYQDGLAWDEMLGSIAELTHPKIGASRYDLLTAEEWKARAEAREKRMAEIRSGNEEFGFVEVPRPSADPAPT